MGYKTVKKILDELQYFSNLIREDEVIRMEAEIQKAVRIFVAGAGRSGFVSRGFANRLMHLGYTAYFVGDTTTPPIQTGDLLVIGSGSGKTAGLVSIAEKARALGARIATITINPHGEIARFADVVLCLPGNTRLSESQEGAGKQSIQPVGSMFEQLSWLIYDSIIMDLTAKSGQSYQDLLARHSNLE